MTMPLPTATPITIATRPKLTWVAIVTPHHTAAPRDVGQGRGLVWEIPHHRVEQTPHLRAGGGRIHFPVNEDDVLTAVRRRPEHPPQQCRRRRHSLARLRHDRRATRAAGVGQFT